MNVREGTWLCLSVSSVWLVLVVGICGCMVSEAEVGPWLLMRLGCCGYSHIWKSWVELSHIGCLGGRREMELV